MDKLQCDICGGSLVVQSGGKMAVCDSCGIQYSVERVREKVQEIRGTVRIEGPVQARQTGTDDDVAQWRTLLRKYYNAGDFQAADQIVKKILEAVPTDEEANRLYDVLQVLKFMEIKNGVLVKYSGMVESLIIPGCVDTIGERVFSNNRTLKHVVISSGVQEIGDSAFYWSGIETVSIPDTVLRIGERAFMDSDLKSIYIPDNVIAIGSEAFSGCSHLSTATVPARFNSAEIFGGTPWFESQPEIQAKRWRNSSRCQHCGGNFTGLFTIRCSKCGRPRDY